MSVRVMGLVWDAPLSQAYKLVMLALADHGDHDGGNIFPAVGTLARKTGYSERQIQRLLKDLWNMGLIDRVGQTKYGTNQLRINLDKLANYQPAESTKNDPLPLAVEGGDKMSPPLEMAGGDKMSPGGCQNVTGGVTKCHRGGDIAMSPDPYLTVIKPSIDKVQSLIFNPKLELPDERLLRTFDAYQYTMKLETPITTFRKYVEPLKLLGFDPQFESGQPELKPIKVFILAEDDHVGVLKSRFKKRAERFFSASYGDVEVEFVTNMQHIEPGPARLEVTVEAAPPF